MGFLFRTAFVTMLAALAVPRLAIPTANAEEVVDVSSGLRIALPDGWDRMKEREKGSRRVVAALRVESGKYVQFTASLASSNNYDAEAWIGSERKTLDTQLTDMGKLSVDEDKTIGGLSSVGYTVSGMRDDVAIRVRCYLVKNSSKVFVFRETSFGGAESEIKDDGVFGVISFQEPEASVSDATDEGEPTTTEDKLGNFKLTVPAGWVQEVAPPVEEKTQLRARFERADESGQTICQVDVLRIEIRSPELIKQSPGELVEWLIAQQVFSRFYGANCEGTLAKSMEIDESIGLGSAQRAGSFKLSSRTMQEIAQTREAEKKKAKGIKDIEVPKFKPTVIRGRLAVISPHIYLVRTYFAPAAAENKKLLAEYASLIDSFEFLDTAPKPPALILGEKVFSDTFAEDSHNKKPRKEKFTFTMHGINAYTIEISASLPPGFVLIRKNRALGRGFSCAIVAQDGKNRWFQLLMTHGSFRIWGEKKQRPPEKAVNFETWKSNWESKARGSKAGKTKKFKIGSVKGEGYKKLKGEVNGWPSTFTALACDSSGWRHEIEIETRGGFAKVYSKQIKALLKSIKIKNKK